MHRRASCASPPSTRRPARRQGVRPRRVGRPAAGHVWRLVWYRGPQRTARLSRLELVEHEGFVTLLAERAGVRVPRLVTAGQRRPGRRARRRAPRRRSRSPPGTTPLTDAALDALWDDLRRLHDAGIAHGRIDLDRDRARDRRHARLRRPLLGHGRRDRRRARRATGPRCSACRSPARRGPGRGDRPPRARRRRRSPPLLPYLQEAAMPPRIRDALERPHVDLDDVRDSRRSALGAERAAADQAAPGHARLAAQPRAARLAAYAMIALFGDIDLDTFVDELRDASWWWLAVRPDPRPDAPLPSAVSTMGSIAGRCRSDRCRRCSSRSATSTWRSRARRPASPSTCASSQRFGVPPTTAMSAGVIDSVSGFIVQILLFLLSSGVRPRPSFSTDLSDSVGS